MEENGPDPRRPSSLECVNCGAVASGSYCPACGASQLRRYPPFPVFLRAAVAEFLSWDRRLLRTLWALIWPPGRMTRECLEGRGAQYILPVRLYFWSAAIAYGVHSLIGPDQRATLWVLAEELFEWRGDASVWLVLVLSMPLCAAFLRVLFRDRVFTEHLVFSLHVQSVGFMALTAETLWWASTGLQPGGRLTVSFFGGCAMFYVIVAVLEVYRPSLEDGVLKAIGLMILYLGSLVLIGRLLGGQF